MSRQRGFREQRVVRWGDGGLTAGDKLELIGRAYEGVKNIVGLACGERERVSNQLEAVRFGDGVGEPCKAGEGPSLDRYRCSILQECESSRAAEVVAVPPLVPVVVINTIRPPLLPEVVDRRHVLRRDYFP
jgi:hypothetical protein